MDLSQAFSFAGACPLMLASFPLPPAADADEATAPPRPSDAPLVTAAQAGDRAAMQELYLRHGAYIAGMCARLLRSREEAREITQDTFVIALDKLGQLRDGDAFRAWVAQIAVHLVRQRLRKKRLLRLLGLERQHDDEDADVSLAALAITPTAEAQSELRRLDQLLLRLPAEERIAWMIRFVEEQPLEDVARACNCSLATVKRRIDAAQTLIRREMSKGEP